MTRGANNKSDQDKDEEDASNITMTRKPSIIDNQGMPILAHSRTASYGSCGNVTPVVSAPSKNDHGHSRRHQISSDVLDFAESALMWPGQLGQTSESNPNKISSRLGFSGSCNKSEATPKSKSTSVLPTNARTLTMPRTGGTPHPSIGLVKTRSLTENRSNPANKGRTVLSLFGLNALRLPTGDTELDDFTNKPGRPRANAVSLPNERTDLLMEDSICEGRDQRSLSISRYLKEISQIGVDRDSDSNQSMDFAEALLLPVPTAACGDFCQPSTHIATGKPQNTERGGSSAVIRGTAGTLISPPEDEVAKSEIVPENLSNPCATLKAATANALSTHKVDDAARSYANADLLSRAPAIDNHGCPTHNPRPVSALARAKSMTKFLEDHHIARSKTTPERCENARRSSLDDSTAEVEPTLPGFPDLVRAAPESASQKANLKSKEDTEQTRDVERQDSATDIINVKREADVSAADEERFDSVRA